MSDTRHPAEPVDGGASAVSHRRSDVWLLALLHSFTAAAVAGFAAYGHDPARLAGLPSWGLAVYTASFTMLARAQVVLVCLVLLGLLVPRAGLRWLPAFLLVYGLSLGAELAGTTWGIPFGGYRYTDGLGWAWAGRVPLLIPVSWFCMAVPSWALAGAATRGRGVAARLAAGSLILLAWDLSLDPAMSWVTRYWVWADGGPYYGMPLTNLLGWYLTGVALMGVLAATRADRWLSGVPLRALASLYVANLVLPLGMNAAAGLTWAVVAGVVPIALLFLMVALGARSRARRGAVLREVVG